MSFELSPDLWPPQRRAAESALRSILDKRHSCCYSPTGGGKTRIAGEIGLWCLDRGWSMNFYLNRRLLIPQTAAAFRRLGLPVGIRAADYEDEYDHSAPIQICSADTERSRVYDRKIWDLSPCNVMVIDEAHLQRTGSMKQLMADHKDNGAVCLGLTATPIGLSDWFDDLIVPGKLAEYRECKALVPAVVYSVCQPDLSKVQRNESGEYILDGKKKKIYTQHIVGDVIDHWKKHNPDARPTMAYWPGKPESVWGTEQFTKLGVNWCHVDATDAVVDGTRYKLTRTLWDEILDRYKDNDIKGLSSRFKLREGIDAPGTFMALLATPIGSLASYLQTIGRVVRHSEATPDNVIVLDFGGNYWRHGSPNHDRDWHAWWSLPEHAVSGMHEREIREGKAAEPIRCPKCGGERVGGSRCPHCGFEHPKSQREVIYEDGHLETKEGHLLKRKRVHEGPDTQQLWDQMYYGFRNSRKPSTRSRSFNQLEGFFTHTHGYHPPHTLRNMPRRPEDWYRAVGEVERSELT